MTVKTRIRVSLDIMTESSWGDNCTIAQVKKQSLDSAISILNKAIEVKSGIVLVKPVDCLNIIISEDVK